MTFLNNIYLSHTLKEKYMLDFKSNVLTEVDNSWKLDSKLTDILIKINKNPNIQSLYSKTFSLEQSSNNKLSYFYFSYTEDIELIIFRKTIPILLIKYNKFNEHNNLYTSILTYKFCEPSDNLNYDGETPKSKMGCLTDPDYFRVNHIRITLQSHNPEIHGNFWQDIKQLFSTIN